MDFLVGIMREMPRYLVLMNDFGVVYGEFNLAGFLGRSGGKFWRAGRALDPLKQSDSFLAGPPRDPPVEGRSFTASPGFQNAGALSLALADREASRARPSKAVGGRPSPDSTRSRNRRLCFVAMSSRPRTRQSANNPRAAASRSWRASLIRKKAQVLGEVQAPSREAAEAAAVREFNLTDEQRSRLVVQERG
jgi:hypothetical protein